MARLFAAILVFGLTVFAVIETPKALADLIFTDSEVSAVNANARTDYGHLRESSAMTESGATVPKPIAKANRLGNTTVTFQDGVSGYTGTRDTYIYHVSPATARGAENLIIQDKNPANSPPDERTSLLLFDLSSIPAGVTIVSAQLDFYVDSEGQGFHMFRMNVPWNEATASFTSIGDKHFMPDGIDAEIYASDSWPGVDGYVGPITVPVQASTISDWVNGVTANNGWMMVSAHADDGVQLRSSEHATVANRPKLTVVYNETPPNFAPSQPVVVSPPDNATGVPTSPNLEVSVADPNAGNLTVTYYGRPYATPAQGADFTVIAIPDTQHYTDNGGANSAHFAAQTQWIVDNKDALNIKFVSGLGDIVQNGSAFDSEWLIASAAYATIENPVTTNLPFGISYGLVVGNHDQTPIGGGNTASTAKFNEYFGISRFAGRDYYGGHYGTDNDNNWELFSAGGMDFIVIHLEFDSTPLPAVVAWADTLLQTYSNRRAIVATHHATGIGFPGVFSNQATTIYNALKDRPNFFMLLGGHIHGEGRRQDSFEGRTVWSILSDYQARANGGDGWLRIMTFSPANNTITVKTYSPSLLQFETDYDSQFTLSYDMSGSVPFSVIGTDTGVPSGTNSSINWPGLETGTEYEWYVTVSDGDEMVTGPVSSFTTIGPTPTNTATFTPTATDTPTSTATATPTPTPTNGIDHVVWIWFENKENTAITAASAPFFANFAANGVNFTEFYGHTHPSQPNYLHAFAGSNLGITTNNYCTFPVPANSLPQQLAAAGKSWRVYAQNYPGGCSDVVSASGGIDGWGAAGTYDRKHNPAIPFEGTRLNPAQCANIQPLANFDPLVNFSFVVPNNINSMHDGTIAQGNAFLQAFMPQVTNSPDWAHTLVIVSFDEGTTAINGGGHIYTAAIAPWITPGTSSSTFYNHHSVLRTIEDIFGLPYLGGATTSTTMTELFPTGPTPTNTATNTPTSTATQTNTPTDTPTPEDTPSVSGMITYGNSIGNPASPRLIQNVSMSASGSPNVGPVITGSSGTYTLTGFGPGAYVFFSSKPNGSNGAISSNDAARIAQAVSGIIPFVSNNQSYAADVNGSGVVSSNDAARIARFVAGLTDTGNTAQWQFFCPPGPSSSPPFTGSPTPSASPTPSVSPTPNCLPSTVPGPITGADIVGLLVGDVSGNWNPAIHPRPEGEPDTEGDLQSADVSELKEKIIVDLPKMVTDANNEVIVPVNIYGAADKNVISYEFDLRYDPTVLQPLTDAADVVGTVSRGLSVVTNPYEPGLLRVVVYGALPIDSDGLLMNLRFTAVGATGSVSPLTWERIMFNEGESLISAANGQVELSSKQAASE